MIGEGSALHAAADLMITNPLIFPLVPHGRRRAMGALWDANRHFSVASRGGREPMLRQIKLQWWADQLTGLCEGGTHPDPLLTSLAQHVLPIMGGERIAELALGWAAAAGMQEGEHPPAINDPAAHLFTMSAMILGIERAQVGDAGQAWGAVERALCTGGDADWNAIARHFDAVRLPTLPRSLAALTALGRAIARRRGQRSPGREQLVILRVGIFGR